MNDQAAPPVVEAPQQATEPAPEIKVSPRIGELHALVMNHIRQYNERGIRRSLSVYFPEQQRELYNQVTRRILASLEISETSDEATLQEWIATLREDPNILNNFIREELGIKR